METFEAIQQAWSGLSAPHVALLVCLGTLVQEELTLASAGILSAAGDVSLWPCLVGGFTGLVVADNTAFLVGRQLGQRVLAWKSVRRITGGQAERGRLLFERRGVQVVCATRLLPGARIPVFLLAGAVGMPWGRFFPVAAAAAALWSTFIVFAGRLTGPHLIEFVERMGSRALSAVLGAVVLAVVGWRTLVRYRARAK